MPTQQPLDTVWTRTLLWIVAAASLAQTLVSASELRLASDPVVYDSWQSYSRDVISLIVWSAATTVLLVAAALILRRHPAGGRALAYLGGGSVLLRSLCAYPNLTIGPDDGGSLVTDYWVLVEIVAAFVGPLALVAAILLLRKAY